MRGAAADNTSAASDRVVAIAVLSQLESRAEVLERIDRALALCNLMPLLSYSWLEARLVSMPRGCNHLIITDLAPCENRNGGTFNYKLLLEAFKCSVCKSTRLK